MPQIRPFRALRYALRRGRRRRGRRRPAVRRHRRPRSTPASSPVTRRTSSVSTCPTVEPGEEPDERYRRAAKTLAAWRSDGTLHKDPRSAIYVYEQTYRVPGHRRRADAARVLRAAPARAVRAGLGRAPPRAHARGPARGPLPAAAGDRRQHEPGRGPRTTTRPGRARRSWRRWPRQSPPRTSIDDDGVRHRLWIVEADGTARGPRGRARGGRRRRGRHDRRRPPSLRDRAALPRRAADVALVRGGPGVRLPADAAARGDRRAADDPADAPRRAGPGRGRGGGVLRTAAGACSTSGRRAADELLETFEGSVAGGGAGRFGLWTRDGGAILTARRECLRRRRGARCRRRSRGSTPGCSAWRSSGARASTPRRSRPADRVRYTKSAAEALALVDGRHRRRATPRSCSTRRRSTSVVAVARSGDVMPQKSTYFYPKALTGLVINPHEW